MATDNIYDIARQKINRSSGLSLSEKRKIREMAKVIDDTSRYNDIINRGGAFSLAEKEMLRKILDTTAKGGQDGGRNDSSSRPADPTDYNTIRKKINRTPGLTNKEKKIWRDFFKDVKDNYVQFLPGEYFIQSGVAAVSETVNPILYGYVSETTQTELAWYSKVGAAYDRWAYREGDYIITSGTVNTTDGIIRLKYDGTTTLAAVDETVGTNTGNLYYGIMTNQDKFPGYGISFANANFSRNHSLMEIDHTTPAFTELSVFAQDSIRGSYHAIDFRRGDDLNTPTKGDLYVIGSDTGAKPMIWEIAAGAPPVATYKGSGSTAIGNSHQYYGHDRDNHLIYRHDTNKLFTLDVDNFTIDAGSDLTGLTGTIYANTFASGYLVLMNRPGGSGTMVYLRTYSLSGTEATLVDSIELGTGSPSANAQLATSPYTDFVYFESNSNAHDAGIYKIGSDGTITQLMVTDFYNASGAHYHAFDWLGATPLPTL